MKTWVETDVIRIYNVLIFIFGKMLYKFLTLFEMKSILEHIILKDGM